MVSFPQLIGRTHQQYNFRVTFTFLAIHMCFGAMIRLTFAIVSERNDIYTKFIIAQWNFRQSYGVEKNVH